MFMQWNRNSAKATELGQIDAMFEFGICLLEGAETEQNLSKRNRMVLASSKLRSH
jgi:hypothetical protein